MTYTLRKGWTKTRLIEAIEKYVPEKHRSWSDDLDTCAYYGHDNDRCAVGACLPDDALTRWPWLLDQSSSITTMINCSQPAEGNYAQELARVRPGCAELLDVLPLAPPGMRELQNVHDMADGCGAMPRQRCVEWVNHHVTELTEGEVTA